MVVSTRAIVAPQDMCNTSTIPAGCLLITGSAYTVNTKRKGQEQPESVESMSIIHFHHRGTFDMSYDSLHFDFTLAHAFYFEMF